MCFITSWHLFVFLCFYCPPRLYGFSSLAKKRLSSSMRCMWVHWTTDIWTADWFLTQNRRKLWPSANAATWAAFLVAASSEGLLIHFPSFCMMEHHRLPGSLLHLPDKTWICQLRISFSLERENCCFILSLSKKVLTSQGCCQRGINLGHRGLRLTFLVSPALSKELN